MVPGAKNGALAEAEFQKNIDHRGWDVMSPLWPMAHLGLARAAELEGDPEKARSAYEQFFLLWKDADPELTGVDGCEERIRTAASLRRWSLG